MKLFQTISLLIIVLIFTQGYSYTQFRSYRFNFKDKQVQGWKQITISDIIQIIHIDSQNTWIQAHNLNGGINLYAMEFDKYSKDIKLTPIKGFKTNSISPESKILVQDNSENLISLSVVSPKKINHYECQVAQKSCRRYSATRYNLGSTINQVSKVNSTDSYIATDTGLYKLEYREFSTRVHTTPIKGVNVYDVQIGDQGIVAAGTDLKLWLFFPQKNEWRYEYTTSAVDYAFALAWNQNQLWVAGNWAGDVITFDPEQEYEYIIYRTGFIEGMPSGNFTSLYFDPVQQTIYFGGKYGVASFSGKPEEITQQKDFSNKKKWQGIGQIGSIQSPWNFYQGQRWVTGGDIKQISSEENFNSTSSMVYINTEQGLTILDYDLQFTLSQKAQNNQNIVQNHDRYGYFSDASLKIQGDSTQQLELLPYDSDSIWTNMYLASQSFRYSVEQSAESKEQAQVAFQALQRLYKVTGVKGLMARTVAQQGDKITGNQQDWHNSTVSGYEQWIWKSGASSDDVISFYFGLPNYIELVCETNQQKQEAIQILVDTADYILQNNYTLIDINGQRTKWGFWGPQDLNENEEHYGERGINSLEIISMLSVAYHYTENQKYLDAINHLDQEENYFQNILNWRLQKPDEENFSDDELAYLSLFAFYSAQSSLPEDIVQKMNRALARTYAQVQAYHPSLYTYITFLSVGNKMVSQDKLKNAELELQQWPEEWISWNIDNSERQDVVLNNEPQRNNSGEKQGVGVLKRSERAHALKWNTNPYNLINEGNGMSEIVPTYWLLPYWMGRYIKHNNIHPQFCFEDN